MLIGELAGKCGVNVQTIRFYERSGLLLEPTRKDSGYRIYGQADIERVSFIRHAKTLGFSLKEIREILAMRRCGQSPCEQVISFAERHLHDVERQIGHLERFRGELARAVRKWKKSEKPRLSADAICALIERSMNGRRSETS